MIHVRGDGDVWPRPKHGAHRLAEAKDCPSLQIVWLKPNQMLNHCPCIDAGLGFKDTLHFVRLEAQIRHADEPLPFESAVEQANSVFNAFSLDSILAPEFVNESLKHALLADLCVGEWVLPGAKNGVI